MTRTTDALDAALDVVYSLINEDGRTWGEAAAPFQVEDARHVLDPTSPTPYHYLTRSRGSSKTTDLAAFVLAVLARQLGPGDRAYAIAVDRDQARLLQDAAVGYINRTPGLRDAFDVGAWRIMALHTGATLDVLAADAPGAWGLRSKFTVLDEVARFPTTASASAFVEAIMTAAAKLSDARMVLLTTAGSPSHPSHKLLEHARGHEMWRVHEVPGPAPWMDPDRLAEQKARLPESSYMRLFENVWARSISSSRRGAGPCWCAMRPGPRPCGPSSAARGRCSWPGRSPACGGRASPARGCVCS